MTSFEETRNEAARKEVADADAALRLPTPRQRLDSGLGLVIVSTALVGMVGAWLLASGLDVSGHLDPPVIAEVEDPRILADYRDNPSPIVDLVASGRDLLIGRRDGTIDRFDTGGRLFASESLPRTTAFSGDLALLSVDCSGEDCATGQAETVYALTAEGGLAARHDGEWQVVLGDMVFVGIDGTPVDQADLRGWAVSNDGALVLADAGGKGLGLFDQRDGSWQTGPAIPGVTHGPLFHQGAFWLGSPAGVHRVAIANGRAQWSDGALPGAEGEVLDLAAGNGTSGLLALQRGICSGGGTGCLSLLQIGRNGDVTSLLQEVEAHPALNDSGLKHVVMQAGDLLTLGSAGVHRYEAAGRRWRLIDPQEPTAWFAGTDGDPLHVALPDRVITLSQGRLGAAIALEAPLVQIVPGDGAALFGLDRLGRVLDLTAPTARILAPADSGMPADARFTTALALDDLFVALGPQGVLIHDAKERRYSFVPAQAMPPVPLSDTIVVAGNSGKIWLVARADGTVWSLTLGGDFPAKQIEAEAHGSAGIPVTQARFNTGILELIGREGQVARLMTNGRFSALVGNPLQGRFSPVSVTANGAQFVFTDGSTLWAYRPEERGWRGPVSAPQGARLTDLAYSSDGLLGLDAAGLVHALGDSDWVPVAGGPQNAAFGSTSLQDAMTADAALYLAADSQVQRYLPAERRFDTVWNMPGRNAEILTVGNGFPLWTNSSGLYRGDKRIFSRAGFVDGWLGASGPVAMWRLPGREGSYYLAGIGGCLHLGQPAPKGEIRDVVQLDAGRLLVRTAGGAGIYEPDLHRWLQVSLPQLTPQSRLLRLGAHLVRIEPDGLASIPIADVPRVDSCDVTSVSIEWSVSRKGRQASLVDGAPEVLLLAANGGLARWRDGKFVTEAVTPGDGPAMARVMRAYAEDESVLMLTPDALWRYDVGGRIWRKWGFTGAPPAVSQMDLVPDGAGFSLTLWDATGAALGAWSDLQGDSIPFEPLRRPVLPSIPIAPQDIRDLAAFEGRTLALSDRKLLLFPAGETAADLEIDLPAPQAGWALASDASGDLILSDGGPAAPVGIYRVAGGLRGRVALDAAAARYRPGNDRAHAFVTEAGKAVLLRIDREQNAWTCSLPAGGDPACRLLTGPPMALSEGEVVAFDAKGRVLLTASDLWRLDSVSRPVSRLIGPRISEAGQLLQNGTALLYWEGPGRALWLIDGAGAKVIAPAVMALRPAGNDLSMLADGQVSGLRNGRIIPVDLRGEVTKEQILRSHFTVNGHVLALVSGGIIAKAGAHVSDPLLTFAPDAATVLPVPANVAKDTSQWLEAGADGRLTLRFVAQCDIPPPEPLPVDFIGPPPRRVEDLPATVPCAQELLLPLRLEPGEVLMDLAQGQGGALQILTNQRDVTLDQAGSSIAAQDPANLAATPRSMRDARPPGGFHMVDGRSWLNPPRLEGGRFAGSGSAQPLSRLSPAALPAFDTGWLSWQRAGRQIRYSGGAQPVDLPLTEAIIGGRFLSAQDARALRLPGGGIAWMMASGLWHQEADRMWPLALRVQDLPVSIDTGQFIGPQVRIAGQDGSIAATPATRAFRVGGLDLEVEPVAGKVQVTIAVGGKAVVDTADRGFVHDRRISVAQSGGLSYFLTPVGLIPLRSLTGGVTAAPLTSGLAAEGGAILAETNAGWLQLTNAQAVWARTDIPFRNSLLADENGRRWEMRDGVVGINSADTWRIARQGLEFDIDRLLGFAATPEVAVAVTGAGTHAAPDFVGLGGVNAPVAAAPSGLPLDSRRANGRKFILYTSAGRIWDAGGWRDAGPDERPWQARQAATLAGISVDFDPAPRPSVEVRAVGDDRPARLAFDWGRAEAMPFDHVTALHADDGSGEVLIGTKLGMRVLSAAASGYSNGPIRVPLRAGQAISASVTAAGRPDSSPDRAEVAFSGGECATMPALADSPQPCVAAAALQTRFVSSDDFSHVSKTAANVRWAYLVDGQQRPLTLPMGGRMPHDLLADRLDCGGTRVEHWFGSGILRIGRGQYELPGLQGLHCQQDEAKLDGGVSLSAGLYALLPNGASRFDGKGFADVPAAHAAALAGRISGRVVLEASRLRYGLAGGVPVTDHLSLSGNWVPTPWVNGRLVLDQPRALAWRGGLQTVTDAGVLGAPGGSLDPRTLVVMTGADAGTLAQCAVIRAETLDGKSHGLPASPGSPLRLYCRDGSWLQGITDGKSDTGTFLPAPPVVTERALVAVEGLWSASASYGADGLPASVAFTFRDEPARLGAGRFDFDTLQGIAAAFADKLELLTDSGWWRAKAGDPALRDTVRPDAPLDPRAVAGFSRDLSRRTGDSGLCLSAADGKGQFWSGGNALEAAGTCREDRGHDALWQWWHEVGQPRAFATSLNGLTLERTLVRGRFTDLVLNGPPLEALNGTLLVPGGEGVLVLDPQNGTTRGIFALDPGGVLIRAPAGDPVWLGRTGPVLLVDEGGALAPGQLTCPGLVAVAGSLPEDHRLLRLNPGGEGWADLLITSPGTRIQALIECDDPDQSVQWSTRHVVADHSRSLSLGAGRINQIQFALVPAGVVLSDGRKVSSVPGGPGLDALRGVAVVPGDEKIFVIDEQRLFELSLAPAISHLSAHGTAVQPAIATSPSGLAPAEVAPQAGQSSGVSPRRAPPQRQPQAAQSDRVPPAPTNAAPDIPLSATSQRDEPRYDAAAVQAVLARVLTRRIAADGILGQRSRAAIADWQRQIGADATGFLSAGQVGLLLSGGGQ